MQMLRLIAAAAIATGGLAFAAPALAAPKGPAGAPEAGPVILVAGQGGVEDSDWLKDQDDRDRRRERSRAREQDRKDGRAERRQDRREERRADRGDRRDDDWHRNDGRGGDWDHDRHGGQDHNHDWDRRGWDRRGWDGHDRRWGDDRRNDWGNSYRWGYPYGWNRGNHYGWDRGNHYGWDRGAPNGWRPGYGQPSRFMRAYHHPQYRYWVGRHLPRRNFEVVRRYEDYYLPRPGRGTYYARSGNDVYLVAESTRRILDAFLLADGSYRR